MFELYTYNVIRYILFDLLYNITNFNGFAMDKKDIFRKKKNIDIERRTYLQSTYLVI